MADRNSHQRVIKREKTFYFSWIQQKPLGLSKLNSVLKPAFEMYDQMFSEKSHPTLTIIYVKSFFNLKFYCTMQITTFNTMQILSLGSCLQWNTIQHYLSRPSQFFVCLTSHINSCLTNRKRGNLSNHFKNTPCFSTQSTP